MTRIEHLREVIMKTPCSEPFLHIFASIIDETLAHLDLQQKQINGLRRELRLLKETYDA